MAAGKKRGKKEPEEKNTNTPSIERSLREDAEEQLTRNVERSPGLDRQSTEELIHELQVHQIELEMQAEELRKAHLILEESRNRYIDLYEFAPTGYLTFTDKALITDVNLTAAVLLGVERNEIINHGIGRFIVPTDHETWDQYFMDVRNRGEKQVCALMLTRGDGSLFPARLEGVRTSSSNGTTTVRIAFSDITDIWQIEALKESESFNRSLVESLPDYIIVYGPDGKILYANPATVRAFGYTMEELAGTSVLSYIAPECHDEVPANMAARLDGHDPPDYEMVIIAKDGQRKTVIAKGTLVHYNDGPAILLLLIDITERKRSEEALRMSESKINAMLQSVADSMSMMDKDLNIIWANETSRQYFGEDLVGRKCYEAYHQRQNPCEPYPCITLRAFHDGKVHRHETTVVDTQGQTHFFECSANVALKDENGEPVAVLEISRDITERKRAEAALKEREQFIQEIIHNAKEGIIVYDRNFNYRVWNPFMESITGISATGALGNNAIDLFPHLKEQKIHILLQRALSGETVQSPDTPYHVPQSRKSGWVSGIYSPHFNDQGVIVGVVGIIHDITDWKKADDALRESEGTFKALAENANDGILVAVTEDAHTYANRRVCEMLGYSVAELQKSSIKDLVVPDEAATLIERFRKRLLGEDIPQQYVTSLLHKDGKIVPVEISAAKTSWHGQPADLVII
ncbi:MAG: PAS domain S-box protein, partial [Methanomicrobiales archaeon]